jgi:hypothetical protein
MGKLHGLSDRCCQELLTQGLLVRSYLGASGVGAGVCKLNIIKGRFWKRVIKVVCYG